MLLGKNMTPTFSTVQSFRPYKIYVANQKGRKEGIYKKKGETAAAVVL